MMPSAVPPRVMTPLVRLYETIPFLEPLSDVVVGVIQSTGVSEIVALLTAGLVIAAIGGAAGNVLIRVLLVALPTPLALVSIAFGVGVVTWVVLTPALPDGPLLLPVKAFALWGALVVAGLPTVGLDIDSVAAGTRESALGGGRE